MKNVKKKLTLQEPMIQKTMVGLGICALVLGTVIFVARNKESGNMTLQNIEPGENNPVSGPVADEKTREEEKKQAAEDKQEKEENQETERKTVTGAQVKGTGAETSTKNETREIKVEGYNGRDKLCWPVVGNVIIPYSMDTTVYFETLDQYQCNPALYLQAEQGTKVRAAGAGKAVEIREEERFGKVITVDMGNGYVMKYGQLENISLKEGDEMKAGDVIGVIAEPTDYFVLEGSHLYLQMTKEGQPVNPAEYLE